MLYERHDPIQGLRHQRRREFNMQHLERVIADINEACDDNDLWQKVCRLDLISSGWTAPELEELNTKLADLTFSQLDEQYDSGTMEPMIWCFWTSIIGTFDVTHPDYSPVSFRTA